MHENLQSPYPQRRKYRRFSLRYPVHVLFRSGDSVSELRAVNNNVSLGGVLLETATLIPEHCQVSFTLTVQKDHIVGPVQLTGEGEVVRVEPHTSGSGFAIAVKCQRPLAKLQDYLPTPVR